MPIKKKDEPSGNVAYYRVSTEKQKESGLGLESQEAIIKHFFPKIVESFTEHKSGSNMSQRPILREAIAYCKANNYMLVVAKLDRLSRNTEDTLMIFRELNENLRSADVPGKLDKFTLTLYAAFAERERELIALRTIAAFDAKRSRGEPMGTPENLRPQYAGQVSGKLKQQAARENPANIRALSFMHTLLEDGLTTLEIAARLNESQHLTSKGNKWSEKTVTDKLAQHKKYLLRKI